MYNVGVILRFVVVFDVDVVVIMECYVFEEGFVFVKFVFGVFDMIKYV